MFEDPENEKVAASVLWLVSKVRSEERRNQPQEEAAYCKLNDYSEFETPYIIQALDSHDRI